MANVDFTNLKAVEGVLLANPNARITFQTLMIPVEANKPDIVRLMLSRNIERGVPFSPEELNEVAQRALSLRHYAIIEVIINLTGISLTSPGTTVSCGNDLSSYMASSGINLERVPQFIYWAIERSLITIGDATEIVFRATREPQIKA